MLILFAHHGGTRWDRGLTPVSQNWDAGVSPLSQLVFVILVA